MSEPNISEVLWLLEVSHPSFKDGRGFWSGGGWGWDALKAARFATKEDAEKCAKAAINEYLWYAGKHKIEICDHMFNCGIEGD